MLYLVTGTVDISHYMQDEIQHVSEMRLVEADSAWDAEAKFKAHFEKDTSEYSVYYSVWDASATATII